MEATTGKYPFVLRCPHTDMKILFWYDDGKIYCKRSMDNLETFFAYNDPTLGNTNEDITPLECVNDADDSAFSAIITLDNTATVVLCYFCGGVIKNVYSPDGSPPYTV
jgi:hypothetical protein